MNWKKYSESKPVKGKLIAIKRFLDGFYIGRFDGDSYLSGCGIPEGYLGISENDLWLELPEPIEQ